MKRMVFLVIATVLILSGAAWADEWVNYDDSATGAVIREVNPRPMTRRGPWIYHWYTVSEDCFGSWQKLLEEIPELEPIVFEGGVSALEDFECVEVVITAQP